MPGSKLCLYICYQGTKDKYIYLHIKKYITTLKTSFANCTALGHPHYSAPPFLWRFKRVPAPRLSSTFCARACSPPHHVKHLRARSPRVNSRTLRDQPALGASGVQGTTTPANRWSCHHLPPHCVQTGLLFTRGKSVDSASHGVCFSRTGSRRS